MWFGRTEPKLLHVVKNSIKFKNNVDFYLVLLEFHAVAHESFVIVPCCISRLHVTSKARPYVLRTPD